MIKRRIGNRLEMKLILTVLLALGVAALVFLTAMRGAFAVLDRVFYSEGYQEYAAQRGLNRLQDFIDRNDIALSDLSRLDEWCRREGDVYLSVYADGALVYDSVLTSKADYTVYNTYYENYVAYAYSEDDQASAVTVSLTAGDYPAVAFADGEGRVDLYTHYQDWYYNTATVASAILAFLVFLIVLTGMIRAKLAYIGQLEREIRILEGGDLRYPITVRGKDELGDLAHGMDDMRRSIIEREAAEEKARRANQELITAISHDLRTPLTSLLGYLDIVREGKYTSEEQRDRYLHAAHEKAYQIKSLSDKLFEYFLVYSQDGEALPLELLPADELLPQMLGERAFDLESQGFTVESDLRPIGRNMRVNVDILCRICDNVFSNVLKYADKGQPVSISCLGQGSRAVITVRNAIAPRNDAVESTNIGLKTCESGAAAHGGKFTAHWDDSTFTAELILPLE